MEWSLTARPPFSLPAVVHSHGWSQLLPFESTASGDRLTYVVQLGSGQVVAPQIEAAPEGVRVTVHSRLAAADQAELNEQLTWMLALDQDFSDFYALAEAEPKLAHVVQQAAGRLLRAPTLFEDMVKTILTTNTTWSGTKRMVRSLVTRYGTSSPANSEERAFPTPEQLATSAPEALRVLGLGYRAPYVWELAKGVVAGQIDLEELKTAPLPTPEVRKRLLAIKGIGDYAAANMLMLLGRYDAIPVDSSAVRVVSHEWYGGRPVGREEVEAAFAHWGAFKGLAFWLWQWSE
jgi:3-methyladenine DNA glycosylase/8-oxoguanine DNA glycosylase